MMVSSTWLNTGALYQANPGQAWFTQAPWLDSASACYYRASFGRRTAIVPLNSIVSGTSRMPECQRKGSVVKTA